MTLIDLKLTVKTCLEQQGNMEAVAKALRLSRSTVIHRIDRAIEAGLVTREQIDNARTHAEASRHDRKFAELEQKLKFLTAQNKMLEQDNLSNEQVKAFIHEAKQYRPIPPKWMMPKHTAGLTGTPILMASDWHWGETVSAAQMNYVNAYSREIAHARAERFFAKPIDLLLNHMAHPKYDRLIMPCIGDMLSGNIHEELAESNWAPVLVCLVDLLGVMIAGLEQLGKAFGKVYVPWIVGNHGRTHKKMRFKNRAFDNYEWILGHMLARHFAGNDAFHFEIADSPNLPFNVYNTRFLMNHGDEFRGGGGISGIFSPIIRGDAKKRRQAMATNRNYDYLLIGHWHCLQSYAGVRTNGTLKGMDEFSQGMGFDFQRPCQDLFVVHPEHGITCQWPLYVSDVHEDYSYQAKAA